MHEVTRRTICRLGFLLLALLPTTLVVGWLWVRQSSSYLDYERRGWETALGRQLGLRVSLGGLEHPSPRVTLFRDVALLDPETNVWLARARVVEYAHNGHSGAVLASQAAIRGDRLGHLWGALERRLLQGDSAGAGAFRLAAADVTVEVNDKPLRTLTDVSAALFHTPAGPDVTLEFRVAGLDMPDAIQFRALRQRDRQPPRTRWELKTHTTFMPCELIAAYVPALHALGNASLFQGGVHADQAPEGWTGEIHGHFRHVDLSKLVAERFRETHLAGQANVTLNTARFAQGRLTEAAGSIESEAGVVSQSLLESLHESLGFVIAPRVQQASRLQHPFQRLAFSFRLDGWGLTVEGGLPTDPPGTILADQSGFLVSDGAVHRMVPAVNLVHALSPDSRVQVPATAEAYGMLRWLPWPPVQPPDNRDSLPPSRPRLQASR